MKRIICILALMGMTGAAYASNDINLSLLASQSDFRLLSEDLGAALSYKSLLPAEPLGITGFDVGVEATSTQLANASVFDQVTGSSIKTLIIPKVHVDKGLPFGIDVGAFMSKVPASNISLTGAEIRYALIEGGIAMPAVAVRATYTQVNGISQLAFNTRGIELTASKGILMFTPYAGVGEVWVDSNPSVAGLSAERFTEAKYYVGTNMNLGLLNFDLEADKTGKTSSIGLKVGFRF